ncbi:hypothetical protein PFISCL1PPCAC_18648, partial [Pristionchus fissidentatus]
IIRDLLLLLSVVLLTQTRDYHIDLERCVGIQSCFVRKSCLTTDDDKNVLYKLETNAKLTDFKCDVIMQIRVYNRSKWHVMMQVDGSYSGEKLSLQAGLELFQTESQFSCNKDG